MNIFFDPSAIAVIGARKRKGGYQIVQNLLFGYQGSIYPVNPNYDEIGGLPCFPSVEAIPGRVDLAIILVPAAVVPDVLASCARKGVRGVMIESAGFAEVGKEGKQLQSRCVKIAKDAGIRIWGPNCMGLVDVGRKKYFTFMNPRLYSEGLVPGRISMVVQSGMLSGVFVTEMSRFTIGIGKVCSIGNKADVDESDLLEYLLADPDTDVVALYLESIVRGRRFIEIVGQATKPVVVLKGGKSEAGSRAAISHTSSLSGNSRLLESLLRLKSVTLANDFHQMVDLSRTLMAASGVNPLFRTAILTFSGGAGILTCDLLEKHQLPVAQLSKTARSALKEIFPPWMPVDNPVDLYPAIEMSGRRVVYNQAIASVLEDSGVDAVIIHHVAGLDDESPDLDFLKQKADNEKKLLVFWLVGREESVGRFRYEAQTRGIQVFGELSRAVECLAAASRYYQKRPSVKTAGGPAGKSYRKESADLILAAAENQVLDEYDSKRLLSAWQIPVVEEKIVSSLSEARQAAAEIGLPLVVKGLIPGRIHKTESGLIRLGINRLAELEDAFRVFKEKIKTYGGRVLLQKQVEKDYELILGYLHDEAFGPCVMFGLGGIFSEYLQDAAFATAPLSQMEATHLTEQIRGKALLEGVRGMKPLARDRIAELLVNLGNLGTAYSGIEQIDINPVVIKDGIPMAVDASVILKTGSLRE